MPCGGAGRQRYTGSGKRSSGWPARWAASLLLTACVEAAPFADRAGPDTASVQPSPSPATPDSSTAARDDALEIHFLDVGQGDAVLLRSGGRSALVDAGPADRVVAQLRALGVDTLDLLVASHNHADHIGGADAVLDSLPVRFYLDNGHPATTRIQERVLQRVDDRGVTYLGPQPRTISLGAARLRVIHPAVDALPEEQNNRSLALVVEHGPFRALLTGDSETEWIHAYLETDSVPDVDLLKAAHHGSRNGVTPAWLSRTRPEVVVLSLGADNPYGHPHAAALRYYCASGRRVLRTDRHGAVHIHVAPDGSYEVRPEREADAGC